MGSNPILGTIFNSIIVDRFFNRLRTHLIVSVEEYMSHIHRSNEYGNELFVKINIRISLQY